MALHGLHHSAVNLTMRSFGDGAVDEDTRASHVSSSVICSTAVTDLTILSVFSLILLHPPPSQQLFSIVITSTPSTALPFTRPKRLAIKSGNSPTFANWDANHCRPIISMGNRAVYGMHTPPRHRHVMVTI